MPSQQPLYVTELTLKSHPYIKQNNIQLQPKDSEKRNIIITGRNGCGKSTFLSLIKSFLNATATGSIGNKEHYRQALSQRQLVLDNTTPSDPNYALIKQQATSAQVNFDAVGGQLNVNFNIPFKPQSNSHALAYFEAKRLTDLTKPTNITAPVAQHKPIGDHNTGKQFLHHLVNRRSQLAFALEDNATSEVEEIRDWFTSLDKLFSRLFSKNVKLNFLRTQLDFELVADDGETIDLKNLSDGYSAIVNMVTEIIMRMEAIAFSGLNVSGIVLIDEVETHLHVALQREILPFLTAMFPNIQFIVTTHSPFVLQSVDDALIYDLESNQSIDQAEELWKYSYEALIDGYFEVDKFSGILRDKILKYKELTSGQELDRVEKKELRQLKKELESVPTFKNATIEAELKQLQLK
ncbi:hypothetical protein CSB62_05250 [Vibrio splendidus]|uniref:ATP-binding cassette domain-containing protein n=1 Tax=Vibrio lentus TaxID=136468 RepID=A0A4U2EU25_9VIBR|nr:MULTISPECIES: AAA family ATPase [Vibrio]OEE52165.1 hypothetical protein A146_22295 [Vibrio splendidus FF-500]PHN87248.1 hypothetical protein CSB62_05250 [Vibrio splendidus]TKG04567.1 ATP-binding cassette domain-containing protein [Vibrio lentus]